LKKVYYRVRQFLRGVTATVSAAEVQHVAEILPPAALALFAQLPVDAQRHSLNVLQTIEAAGHTQLDLRVAALLHDVGKVAADQTGMTLNLWWRGPLVLLENFFPTLLRRWSVDQPTAGWRYLLYVHHAHPQIGATWASAVDCSPLACWLIAHHQERAVVAPPDEQALLRILQWADNQN